MKLNLDILRALTPTGKLRASINLGNPILANRNALSGLPFGVSIDLANSLAKILDVEIDLPVLIPTNALSRNSIDFSLLRRALCKVFEADVQ